jgi:hypothetical protein
MNSSNAGRTASMAVPSALPSSPPKAVPTSMIAPAMPSKSV